MGGSWQEPEYKLFYLYSASFIDFFFTLPIPVRTNWKQAL